MFKCKCHSKALGKLFEWHLYFFKNRTLRLGNSSPKPNILLRKDERVDLRIIYDILPAMIRTLNRCLDNIQMGYIRRIPQMERYSSYDKRT